MNYPVMITDTYSPVSLDADDHTGIIFFNWGHGLAVEKTIAGVHLDMRKLELIPVGPHTKMEES